MLTFGPRPGAAFSSAVNQLVDKETEVADIARELRRYLGGSRLGEECLRKLAYEFHKVARDEGAGFPGRILRIFERGHDAEGRVVDQLRRGGWDIVRGDADDPRTTFFTAQGRVGGHADGLVLGGPEIEWLRYPCLIEIKCLGSTGWGSAERSGVRVSHPEYWAQMQVYMAYLGHALCWFCAENANTCELYCEAVPFDLREAQELSDAAVRVVSTQEPEELPRPYSSRTNFNCRQCFYQNRCWAAPAPMVQVGAPQADLPSWVKRLQERANAKS